LFSAVQSTRCTPRDYVHPKVFTERNGSLGIQIDQLWRLRGLKERTKQTEAAKAGQYTLQATGPATHGNTPALRTPSLSILDRRSPMSSHFVSNPIARLNAALRHWDDVPNLEEQRFGSAEAPRRLTLEGLPLKWRMPPWASYPVQAMLWSLSHQTEPAPETRANKAWPVWPNQSTPNWCRDCLQTTQPLSTEPCIGGVVKGNPPRSESYLRALQDRGASAKNKRD